MKREIKKTTKEIQISKERQLKKIKGIKNGVIKKIISPFLQDKKKLTLGQRTADWLTSWAGSWIFIISFFIFIILWMALNSYFWFQYSISGQPFDPYPFILLNLVLSCLAAIQAPVILMSQNRAGQRDRLRTEYDYQVNRKAEREIRDIKRQLNRIERRMLE